MWSLDRFTHTQLSAHVLKFMVANNQQTAKNVTDPFKVLTFFTSAVN